MRPFSFRYLIPEIVLLAAGIGIYWVGIAGTRPDGQSHVLYPLLSTWGSGITVLVVPIALVSTLFFGPRSRKANLILMYCGMVLFVVSQWVMMADSTQPITAHPGFFLSGCGFGMLYSSGTSLMLHWFNQERHQEPLLLLTLQDGSHRQLPTLAHHPRYVFHQKP